jgi:hypothetical protein
MKRAAAPSILLAAVMLLSVAVIAKAQQPKKIPRGQSLLWITG